MKCTHCQAVYSREAFDALPLVEANGGRQTYGDVVHEYRSCTCGSHVLLEIRLTPRPRTYLGNTPRIETPMFTEAVAHGRRR